MKRGFVYGASDKHGAYPAENPVRPDDLAATIFYLLGIDPQTLTVDDTDSLNLPKDSKGVIVNAVTANRPAEKAGIKAGDVILSVNDKPVATTEELRFMIAAMAPGMEVNLKVARKGKEEVFKAILDRQVQLMQERGIWKKPANC